MMNDSLWTLASLLDYVKEKKLKFYVPSYQRGYRWSATEVRQLLDDIDTVQFGDHYFLQLLAVREDDKKHRLRIIDGQQRLTTALLVLDSLDDDTRINDMLSYETETRKGCSLDKYFMDGASKAINDWLAHKDDAHKNEFMQKLLDAQFLYFPVKNKAIEFEFFTRLNTWKIQATDAELVKCFFLSNDDPADIDKRAIKWNQMERQLSDNQFWGMFSSSENVNEDRMGLLLSYALEPRYDADTNNGTVERFPLYESCRIAEKDGVSRQVLWSRVEAVFSRLLKWHGDRALRHLIGWFFHCSGKTLSEAKRIVRVDEHTVADAVLTANYLCGDGKWLEDVNLYETRSGEDKKWLIDYLLLTNVAWCSECCGVDYDFYRHSLVERWSIEHVHARNQRMLSETEFKSLRFKEKDISALWDEYSKKETKDEANAFLQEKLSEESGYPEADEDNSFGNLALLPQDANSSLNDKLFRGKQREILSWALQHGNDCYWAPPLTVSMFVKEVGDPNRKFQPYWSEDDRKAYSAFIKQLVQEFLHKFPVKVCSQVS